MYIGGTKLEIGDLIRSISDNTLYSGYGIITKIDPANNHWVKIYWIANDDCVWEQIYHIEAYCEKAT